MKKLIVLTLFILSCVNLPDDSSLDTSSEANDGTVLVSGKYWAKCSQVDASGVNMYDATSNDCTGGTIGAFKFCNLANNNCDDGSSLTNNVNSEIYLSCKNLTLAGRSWRVPTVDESKSFYSYFNANRSVFPDTMLGNYWSSTVCTPAFTYPVRCSDSVGNSHGVGFNNGGIFASTKVSSFYLRCVSDGY